MVKVCQQHVLKGLKLLSAPHVKEIDKRSMECCTFCQYKAKYELFLLNSSVQYTFSTENGSVENEDHLLV